MNYNNYYNVSTWNINGYSGTDYSSLSSWQRGINSDLNSNTNNPNFVNPGGSTPEDYKRTSYPVDGRGGSYASIMGAYITGNEIIGYSSDHSEWGTPPVEKPSAPRDFR